MPLLALSQINEIITAACPAASCSGKRVLLIVPDGTRTAPIGLIFQILHRHIAALTQAFDVLIALGTHQPMSETAICRRLDISEEERRGTYSRVGFFNHDWDSPEAL